MASGFENELAQQDHGGDTIVRRGNVSNLPSFPPQSLVLQSSMLIITSSVSIISFIRIFFVLRSDPDNVTGSVVKPDIFSCIELTMAIVFASVAGIAGREAISNFVDRFIVPRSTNRARVGYHRSTSRQSNAGSRDVRMVDSRNWVKIDPSMGEALVVSIDEVSNV